MKRLTLTYKNRRIISDAFNFRAYRLMYDALSGSNLTRAARDAAAFIGVAALFDGTELTENVIRGGGLDDGELSAALDRVVGWYLDVHPTSDEGAYVGTPPEKPILALYNSLLKHHLPGDIDRQDPQLLLDVMAAKGGEMTRVEDIPPELRMFYGM